MGHSHHHKDNHSSKNKRLLVATGLNFTITLTEITGGILSNSLALLSDAIHNLGDTFAVLLAYIAGRISCREANQKKTFGYKRIEILAAFLNAVILIVITFFLFIEAFHRFKSPEPVKGFIMFFVALIGLVANLIAVILLRNDSHHSINIKAAYLHLMGDTISSVAVIIGSVFIVYFKVYWIDPVITLLIGLYILKEAYTVLKETVDILMQGTPPTIIIPDVAAEIEEFDGIHNVHHVHAWKLDDTRIHFECHADLEEDIPASETDVLRIKIEKMLKNKFGISHVTIQFEYNCCDKKSLIHS